MSIDQALARHEGTIQAFGDTGTAYDRKLDKSEQAMDRRIAGPSDDERHVDALIRIAQAIERTRR